MRSARNLSPTEGDFPAPSDGSERDSVAPLLLAIDREEAFPLLHAHDSYFVKNNLTR